MRNQGQEEAKSKVKNKNRMEEKFTVKQCYVINQLHLTAVCGHTTKRFRTILYGFMQTYLCLQCFDTVSWVSGRAYGLQKIQ